MAAEVADKMAAVAVSADAATDFTAALAAKKPYYAKRIELFEGYAKREQERVEAARAQDEKVSIVLPDGAVKEGIKGATTPLEIAEGISKSLAKKVRASIITQHEFRVWGWQIGRATWCQTQQQVGSAAAAWHRIWPPPHPCRLPRLHDCRWWWPRWTASPGTCSGRWRATAPWSCAALTIQTARTCVAAAGCCHKGARLPGVASQPSLASRLQPPQPPGR